MENNKVTDEIYNLNLHEHKEFSCGPTKLNVIRVPGGWIYQYIRLDAGSMWAVFVPFDNEYLTVKK